jgi:hypothetical protein
VPWENESAQFYSARKSSRTDRSRLMLLQPAEQVSRQDAVKGGKKRLSAKAAPEIHAPSDCILSRYVRRID